MKIYLKSFDLEEISTATLLTKINGLYIDSNTLSEIDLEKIKYITKEYGQFFEKICINFNMFNDIPNHVNEIILYEKYIEMGIYESKITFNFPLNFHAMQFNSIYKKRFRTNITSVYSLYQASIAINNDIDFVTIDYEKISEIGQDVSTLIGNIRDCMLNNIYGTITEIIVSNCKNINDIENVILSGLDILAVDYNTLTKMFKHPLTEKDLGEKNENF